jgi:hypothetical protein
MCPAYRIVPIHVRVWDVWSLDTSSLLMEGGDGVWSTYQGLLRHQTLRLMSYSIFNSVVVYYLAAAGMTGQIVYYVVRWYCIEMPRIREVLQWY